MSVTDQITARTAERLLRRASAFSGLTRGAPYGWTRVVLDSHDREVPR